MSNFTPVMTKMVKTVEQNDPVHKRLADLPDYARNAGCAYDMVGRALRWFGWDFAEWANPSDFECSTGSIELELSTMFGDSVSNILYLQWNGNAKRAGEITFNVFIN